MIGSGSLLFIFLYTDQLAVGKGFVNILNRDNEVSGYLIIREIITGKPVVGIFGPGDGGYHYWICWPFFIEEQAALWIIRMIFDGECHKLSVSVSFRKMNNEVFIRLFKF